MPISRFFFVAHTLHFTMCAKKSKTFFQIALALCKTHAKITYVMQRNTETSDAMKNRLWIIGGLCEQAIVERLLKEAGEAFEIAPLGQCPQEATHLVGCAPQALPGVVEISQGEVVAELARLGLVPKSWGRGEYAGRNSSIGDYDHGRVIVSAHEATHTSATGVKYSCGWGVKIPLWALALSTEEK